MLPEDARRHNRALVLQTLFDNGPSSRADLARETALTRVTVSDLVAELMAEDLVEELGLREEARVGKPATLVGLRADAAHIVCLDLSDEDCMKGAVLDLSGTVLARAALPVEGRVGEDAVGTALALCRTLLGSATRPVLGVGVGSPGIVSPDGVVLLAPNLQWTDLPLRERLSEALSLPVHVANDANTAALGEHTFGGAGRGGLMLVRIGRGVGAGLVLDGALLGGHHHAAGEIGHVTVEERGVVCACGRRGCLETVVSVPALRSAVEGASVRARDASLASAGRRLGAALAPVVSALDLREIVLSGPEGLLSGTLHDAALASVRKRTMPVVGSDVDLRMAKLGDDVVLAGAAVLVLSGQLGVS
ncbi:putative NBD/HSP70 family sugar kinase [Motilibacter peucedani]|uniref:Putative NBD/HSP70 family sugar kinase n=1 Tax=Motilibacter peucedani TaxID=598650 RepID=A0A420XLF0_9ACTN|nr:putative NBD/HSP70 family sugar kinase [Motilibacter peucedani]